MARHNLSTETVTIHPYRTYDDGSVWFDVELEGVTINGKPTIERTFYGDPTGRNPKISFDLYSSHHVPTTAIPQRRTTDHIDITENGLDALTEYVNATRAPYVNALDAAEIARRLGMHRALLEEYLQRDMARYEDALKNAAVTAARYETNYIQTA